MAVGDENIIEHDVVKISPDLTGFREKLITDLEKAVKGVTATVNVKLVADGAGFNLLAKEELKKQALLKNRPTYKIRLVADATGFNGTAKSALKGIKGGGTVRIKTAADKASADQAERDVNAGLKRIEGSSLRLADDINRNLSKKLHESFLIPKNAENITTGLKRVRTESERLAADVGKAAEHDLDQFYKDLGARWDKQLQAKKAAAKDVEGSFTDLGRRFALDLGGQRATQANLKDRQQKDEAYAAFHEKITRTLAGVDEQYRKDMVRAEKLTDDEIFARKKHFSTLKIGLLETEAKIQRKVDAEAKKAAGRSRSGSGSGPADQGLLDRLEFPKLLNFGGTGLRPMNALIAAGVALSPVLIAIASNALQAGTSIAALGTASIGAGLAIGGLTVAFSGVTKLFAAYTAFENETIHASANAAAQTKNQANGYNELADKMLAVSDARDNLVAAQKAETAAQKDINKAREKARRDAVDLRQSILDLRNAEQGDTLTVAEAKQHAASLQADFFATAAMKARANQDVRDAMTQLSDDQLALSQKRADLLKSNRQGIEGSDVVTQAKDAADAAHRHVNSAQHTLNRAVKGLNTTQAGQSNSVSAAQALFNEQMRRASPAARDMLGWYKANEKELQRLARVVQQGVLPGFTRFLDAIEPRKRGKGKTTLALFAEAAGQLGGIIGDVVGKVGKWMNTPFFRKAFGKIQAENAADLTKLGKAALTLLDPITRIVVASAPLAGKLADGIQKFATWFADVIKSADKSGKLATWFDDAGRKFGVWMDIGHNLLTLLKNIFNFSLPAGDSLVQRLSNFTKTIADWSDSKDGQKSIKDFFDFFRKLDYGRVTSSAVAIGEIVTVWVAAQKLRKISPFQAVLAALTAWSVANPKEAADLLRNMAGFINDIVTGIAAHPDLLKFMVTMLALGKLGGAVGFSLKLPVLDGIRKFLVSKFSVLEKFVGGGATTATMTVNAGVVNVNGGLKGPGVPGAVGKTSSMAVLAEEAFGVTASLLTTAVAVSLMTAAAAAAIVWAEAHSGKNAPKDPKPNKPFTQNAPGDSGNLGRNVNPRTPKQIAEANAFILRGQLDTATGNEHVGFNNLQNFLHGKGQGAGVANLIRMQQDPAGKMEAIRNNQQIQEYITVRKRATDANFNYEKSTLGIAKATYNQNIEIGKSRRVLSDTLQNLGLSKDAADKYATSIFGASAAFKDATGKAEPLKSKVGELNTQLKDATGKKVISLTMADGSKLVFGDLQTALVYQTALQRNITPDAARQRLKLEKEGTNSGGYVHGATGGAIRGPGTGTSDDIHAMLSNGEHVWTAQEVDRVGGQDAMYRMRAAARTGQFRFAKGGAVGSWPFPVDISKTFIPFVGAPGNASGDVKVSELAEATARNMGATVKQLVALIEAGLVESGLHNLSYGDRDSVGFLQQRAGWGSVKQRMDVAYATRKFIQKARSVDKRGYSAGQLAQAVQVSAFPDRYDMRYGDALAVLNQAAPYVTGMPGAGIGYGGGVGGPGWRWQESVLKAAFGKGVNFFSTTGGGHAANSWHYRGRAVDLTPSMAIFDWIKSHYGANTKELIYGPAGIGIRNGGPYNWGAENAKHKTHIHWAFANGGAVRARTYDGGGDLSPGYTLAFNGTGRTERVNTASQQAAQVAAIGSGGNGPVRLDRRDLATLAGHIVTAMTGQTITMDGRKVAETVRGYDYLPRGL